MMRQSETTSSGRRLYRSRRGLVLGVCRGLAGYLGLPVLVVRAFTVVLCVATGWVGVLGYLAGALFMRLEPVDGETSGRLHRAVGKLSRRARDLDARIAQVESHVTSREYDFDRRLRRS